MKHLLQLLALVCLPALAFGQGGNIGSSSSPVINSLGRALPGVNISICAPLATTGASVTSNLAVLTMSSNPVTAGFVAGMTIQVAGFTGGDTYFNGGTFSNATGITSGFTILSVTSSTITYSLTHANGSASSNGTVLQEGNTTTGCGGLSSIFSDPALATSITQPLVSDGFGNWNSFAAPGVYYGQFYGAGITTTMRIFAVSITPGLQSANTIYSGPSSGAPANAGFRALVSLDIPNNAANTSGNASTATALAATPSQCAGGNPATGIAASGNANCSTANSIPINDLVQGTNGQCSVTSGGNVVWGSCTNPTAPTRVSFAQGSYSTTSNTLVATGGSSAGITPTIGEVLITGVVSLSNNTAAQTSNLTVYRTTGTPPAQNASCTDTTVGDAAVTGTGQFTVSFSIFDTGLSTITSYKYYLCASATGSSTATVGSYGAANILQFSNF
jgi:hypothetical protein